MSNFLSEAENAAQDFSGQGGNQQGGGFAQDAEKDLSQAGGKEGGAGGMMGNLKQGGEDTMVNNGTGWSAG